MVTAGVVGVALAVPSGPATTALAVVVLGIGYAYDLRLQGDGLVVAPVRARDPAPAGLRLARGDRRVAVAQFAILVPTAVLAGAALAIANALADVDRDAAAGVDFGGTSARRCAGLGDPRDPARGRRGRRVRHARAGSADGEPPVGQGPGPLVAAIGASLVIATGIAIGRRGDAARRERAWELEAVGVGLLAAAWLAGVPLGG